MGIDHVGVVGAHGASRMTHTRGSHEGQAEQTLEYILFHALAIIPVDHDKPMKAPQRGSCVTHAKMRC